MTAVCLRETGGGARREASNADVQGGRSKASRTGKGRDPPGLPTKASPAYAGQVGSVIVGPCERKSPQWSAAGRSVPTLLGRVRARQARKTISAPLAALRSLLPKEGR